MVVDEGRASGTYETKPWEDRGTMAAGTILATALAAGVIAFLVRRSREEEEPTGRVVKLARNWADSDTVDASRDFFLDKIVPELKPALLAILEEFEDVVDHAFRQAEKRIKKL